MKSKTSPRISVCIPHWQVKSLITICLRSIRRHSKNYDIEVIIVDNGSKDDSLDYLRGLKWIRLIERPEETHTNWPHNVFTAWDRGIREATGEYFITMHSDVFLKTDDWLDSFLREMAAGEDVGGVGAWKLNLESPLYAWQKRVLGFAAAWINVQLGRKKRAEWQQVRYPRDYCAMYRRDVVLKHGLTFCPIDHRGGGYSIAKQLWDAGYQTRMIPIRELYKKMVHVAHGTAAVVAEKPLHHRRSQNKVEQKVRALFAEQWVRSLQSDPSLDY